MQAQVPAIAVERRLARELDLSVGDTVRLGRSPDSLRFRAVVGAVYQPVADPVRLMRREYQIRLHLPDLAALLDAPDRVDRFGVSLEPGTDPGRAAQLLNRSAYGFRALPSEEVARGASRTFLVVSRFHRAIALISIAASAVFLLCIMLLKVEERRLDTAVLRFVGVSRRTIMLALMLEGCLVALLGSVAGLGLAALGSGLTNVWYGRVFETPLIFSRLDRGLVLRGLLLAFGLGLTTGWLAALRLVRTRPTVLWGRG